MTHRQTARSVMVGRVASDHRRVLPIGRERVRHGKEGYMPPFAKVLTDPQIAAFAKYIKSLTPAD